MTELALLTETFERLGYEIIHYSGIASNNGPDAWVRKSGGRPLSVEIKTARRKKNSSWEVDPVSPPRRKDDLIAIRLGGQYLLVHPMSEHLKCCSKSGVRPMTLLMGQNL